MTAAILVLIIYIALCVVVGYGAARLRRSSFGWFIGAVLFSPIVAGIFLLAAGTASRTCSSCSEPVSLTATRCPYCLHDFGNAPPNGAGPSLSPPSAPLTVPSGNMTATSRR